MMITFCPTEGKKWKRRDVDKSEEEFEKKDKN